jgi:spore germination protein
MMPRSEKIYHSLCKAFCTLKPQGYIVSIDVFPKQDKSKDVSIAYDYAQLAKSADEIMIMTYDNHGS